jgi:pimeloyl-ACP methyl ester carboxylesterase
MAPRPDTHDPCRRVGRQTVTFTTDDGVALEADLYPAGPGSPAALLLHMIPPRHDRRDYPVRFIDALLLRGITVLNLDRRGAGGSKGEAREAYRGPKGWLDAKAAHDFLRRRPCPVDVARLACVGASNGTTSCVDFAVQAEKHEDVATPRAVVLLTGGGYTEAQHRFRDHRPLLEKLPLLFVYGTAEARWSLERKKGAPGAWRFQEERGLSKAAGHGTLVFRARPKSINAVAAFIGEALGVK